MKRFCYLTVLILIPISLHSTPKYSFPHKVTYNYGIMPTTIDHNAVQAAYDDFMELYEEQGDLARIMHDDISNTVSEGIGYGMMVMVYMDNAENNTQPKFDKLWNYYKQFSGSAGGLMSWRISGFSGPANPMMDKNAATDAELDVAVSLLQAFKQWNDSTYLNDARTLIAKIAEHEINANGYIKPGDAWDTEKNPSYFSTAALRLFKHASDFNWDTVITNAYSLLKKARNQTTGLVPDWCNEEGAPSRSDVYSYDATRTPWRLAWAYSWYGDEDAKDMCTKIATWISGKTLNDPSLIVDGYSLDGTESGSYNNTTFVGPFTCAGMVDNAHQEWVDKGFEHLAAIEENVYYQISLKLLTLLYLSGNMPDLWDYPTNTTEAPRCHNSNNGQLSIGSIHPASGEVSFTTTSAGRISLSLFSLSGRLAAPLLHGTHSPGNHRVTLDRSIGNGIYLLKMTASGATAVKRIVLER